MAQAFACRARGVLFIAKGRAVQMEAVANGHELEEGAPPVQGGGERALAVVQGGAPSSAREPEVVN